MSNEHENQAGGSPVEESEATPTQVQAAVSRAAVPAQPVMVPPPTLSSGSATDMNSEIAADTSQNANVVAQPAPPVEPLFPAASTEAPTPAADPVLPESTSPGEGVNLAGSRIAPITEVPSAGGGPTASEIFAAAAASSSSARAASLSAAERGEASAPVASTSTAAAAPAAPAAPTGVVASAPAAAELTTPVRDGEIRISADHPMATLYMQSPMPPDPRGNRVAGMWISLLAAFAFALVYAGAIALFLAPIFPPSSYLTEGLVPALLAPSYLVPVVVFLLANVTLALTVGRSGWWAHIIGSLFVGAVTALATCLALIYESVETMNAVFSYVSQLNFDVGTIVLSILVGLLAREISVWFGAWIGARGRKVTRLNIEALEEYDAALAEVKTTQSVPSATA